MPLTNRTLVLFFSDMAPRWVQRLSATGSIGFHYDKDEAYASSAMAMRFPYVSTVTYLSGDGGAPTLILNQTTPNGFDRVPPVPIRGQLVYPRRNRHIQVRWPQRQVHDVHV